jgi:hypothetical protein
MIYVGGLLIMFVATLLYNWLMGRLKNEIPVAVHELKTYLGPDRWNQIMSAAEMAIHTAEQLRLTGAIEDTSEAAKKAALETVQRFVTAQGIEGVDVQALDDMIEGLLHMIRDTLRESVEEENPPEPEPVLTRTASYFPGLTPTA